MKGLLSTVLKESNTGTESGTGIGIAVADKGARTGAEQHGLAVREVVRGGENEKAEKEKVKKEKIKVERDCRHEGCTGSIDISNKTRGGEEAGGEDEAGGRRRNEVRGARAKKTVELKDEEDEEEDHDEWSDGNCSGYLDEEEEEEEGEDYKEEGDEVSCGQGGREESEGSSEEGDRANKSARMKSDSRRKRKLPGAAKSIKGHEGGTRARSRTNSGSGTGAFPAVVTQEILRDLILPRGAGYLLSPLGADALGCAEGSPEARSGGVECVRADPVLTHLSSLIGTDLISTHIV